MDNIIKAVDVLNKGGVIIFPTDTVFGIGCRIDNEQALKRVFSIRKRPKEKAVLVVVSSISMAQAYLQPIPSDVRTQLMEKFWPGKLTIILPCKTEKVPDIVRAGKETLGVRQTNHEQLLQVIEKLHVPLIAPSANFSGDKTPVTYEDINPELISRVDYVMPGKSLGEKPSTVIDCSVNPWKIVREGAIPVSSLYRRMV